MPYFERVPFYTKSYFIIVQGNCYLIHKEKHFCKLITFKSTKDIKILNSVIVNCKDALACHEKHKVKIQINCKLLLALT